MCFFSCNQINMSGSYRTVFFIEFVPHSFAIKRSAVIQIIIFDVTRHNIIFCVFFSEPLPPKPVDVQSFCSHIVWRNPPNTSFEDITGYDIRLVDPETHREITRQVDTSATFYSLHQIDDSLLKKDSTVIQVILGMLHVCIAINS